MPIEPADLERLLDPSFLDHLESRSMQELRTLRSSVQEAEGALSYIRRLVQGRLDIVAAERARRAEGRDRAEGDQDPAALVDSLSSILADSGVRGGAGSGRLPMQMNPGEQAAALVADLDRRIDAGKLTDLASVPDPELVDLTEELAAIERQMSDHRRALHERIDRLQAELVRRYRSGEASVDSLLA